MKPLRNARPRRILVCPQEFKGSLTAFAAAAAIAAGVRRALPEAAVVERPMADGGPGTVAIVAAAADGTPGASVTRVTQRVRGPLGAPVQATYARIERPGAPPLAVIEAAAAAGLALLPAAARDAARASSYGVGEQIRHALEGGAGEVIVGIGGTATNDGGAGAAQALGLRLLDAAGAPLPAGTIQLAGLARVQAPHDARLQHLNLRIAVDVRNVLLGGAGATAVYGAQKGVADWQAPALEQVLARWAERLREDLGCDVAERPGAGAGGGLPAGLLAACPRARIESGAALVAEAIALRAAIAAADLVITGEGSLDAQTAAGKAVAHVAALAAELARPCLAVAGIVEGRPAGIADAEPLAAAAAGRDAAMAEATEGAARAAARLVARWVASGT